MTLSEQLSSAVNVWVQSGGKPEQEAAVHALLNSPEVKAMSYHQRNAPWITSHKLMALEVDPFLCNIEYNLLIPKPVEQDREAMDMGIAVDDYLTDGEEQFRNRYVAVARRDKKAEEANPGKKLLTNGQMETISNCVAEFGTRHFFPKSVHKRNLLCLAYGLPMKAELDGWDAEKHRPQDVKTTGNLNSFLDDFRPGKRLYDKYVFQQATYAFIYEMGQGERVDAAELLVLDKFDWCRSHLFVISYQTLQAQFPRIERLLQDWKMY